jgi:hypothetical protein
MQIGSLLHASLASPASLVLDDLVIDHTLASSRPRPSNTTSTASPQCAASASALRPLGLPLSSSLALRPGEPLGALFRRRLAAESAAKDAQLRSDAVTRKVR